MSTCLRPSDEPSLVLRAGRPSDASAIARLVNYAGERLPLHLWAGMAEPGQDPWEIGATRALREVGGFSYKNATVLEREQSVIGCLIGYRLPMQPGAIDMENTPPMLVPLEQLEALAAGSWYINVLAIEPGLRGRGYGSQLLRIAEDLNLPSGPPLLSVIVSDANSGAKRLYESVGFRERARRRMVKDGWVNSGREWVLMQRDKAISGVSYF